MCTIIWLHKAHYLILMKFYEYHTFMYIIFVDVVVVIVVGFFLVLRSEICFVQMAIIKCPKQYDYIEMQWKIKNIQLVSFGKIHFPSFSNLHDFGFWAAATAYWIRLIKNCIFFSGLPLNSTNEKKKCPSLQILLLFIINHLAFEKKW